MRIGKAGFAYPALNGWDLGLDNVRIRPGRRGIRTGHDVSVHGAVAYLVATDCSGMRRTFAAPIKNSDCTAKRPARTGSQEAPLQIQSAFEQLQILSARNFDRAEL